MRSSSLRALLLASVLYGVPHIAVAETYTYDALGRIITVVTDDFRTINYSYDAAGNRTQVAVTSQVPTAGPVSLNVAYNTPGSVALAPSGIYTSLAVAAQPSNGAASIANTMATYTPTTGFYGSDSFTYTAIGPGGTSSPATVSVTVSTPGAPSVGNVTLNAGYGTAGSASLTPSGVWSALSVVNSPASGSASISGSTATYTPNAGFYGKDSFTYKATGPGGSSGTGTVSVNVATPPAPTVANASLTTAYNSSGTTSLAPSGNYTALSVSNPASHGGASISGTTATYTPSAGYYGNDSFSYIATGPGGSSAPATVSVHVNNPPAPTAGPVSATVADEGTVNFNLAPSGVYTSTNITIQPAHGTVVSNGIFASYFGGGNFAGQDTFQYTVVGPGGTSSPATGSITVTPVPMGVTSFTTTTPYNTFAGYWPTVSGLINYHLVIGTQAAHGTAAVYQGGAGFSYTPNPGYYGSDSFTFYAANSYENSNTATVTMTVGNPPAPTVASGSLVTSYGHATSQALTIYGAYQGVSISTSPQHGAASLSGTTVTYTPANGFSGNDTFNITASGPGGNSTPTPMSVTVTAPGAPLVNETSFGRYKIGAVVQSTTPDLTITPQSGPAPYTVTWRVLSGDTSLSISTTGTFTYVWTAPQDGTSHNAIWQATVTDAYGAQTLTPQISVSVERDPPNGCRTC